MITQAESGLPVAVYNAINAGGLSAELRVTAFSPDLFPTNEVDVPLFFTFGDSLSAADKLEQVDATRYCVLRKYLNPLTGRLLIHTSSTSTLWYANGVLDFIFDGTHIFVFRQVGSTIFRYQHLPTNASPIATTTVATITIPADPPSNTYKFLFSAADKDNVFYFRETNRNLNLCRSTFSGTWSETVSDNWFYNAWLPTNNLSAITTPSGEYLLVLQILLPGELSLQPSTGFPDQWMVVPHAQTLSHIWGSPNWNAVAEQPLGSDVLRYDNYMTQLVKYGDTYVCVFYNIETVFLQKTHASVSISKDGINWSEMFILSPDHVLHQTSFGRALDGSPILGRGELLKKFSKSPRLYGYANCDAGVNVTNQIVEGSWQFEQSGVMQINMETHSDLGNVLLRHELGYFIDSSMRWIDFATTVADGSSKSFNVGTGQTTYQLNTRDLTAWMIDRFQSYTSREWHGHEASIEDFNGKSTKMAVTTGSLTFGSDVTGPFGTVLVPAVAHGRAHINFTGMEDKRNHCQTYWVQPQGASSFAHLFSIFHPSLTALTGVFLNVTTANIQLRGWHNGVNVMNPAAIVVANAQYFRIQLHYGLLRIYYSTNNTTWTMVDYPLNYTGMVLYQSGYTNADIAPWSLSFPGIGAFGTGSSARFRVAINTNRNKPILIADAVKIAGAFSGILDTKYNTGASVAGSLYIDGVRTGNHTSTLQSSTRSDEIGGNRIRVRGAGGLLDQVSANVQASKLAIFTKLVIIAKRTAADTPDYSNTITTVWNGNEIISSGFIAEQYDSGTAFTQSSTNITHTFQKETIFVDVLTIDVGESPDQGLRRVFDGREQLGYFLRRTGELWMRPTTKNANYPSDTNLITVWTQKDESTSYADDFVAIRKIATYKQSLAYNATGRQGMFSSLQNTLIDNLLETAPFIMNGTQPTITYQCEIPVFQELYDAIENGYRVSRISGKLQSGFLSGSITIGNEELL